MGRPKQTTLLPTFDPIVLEQIRRLRPAGSKIGPKSIYADLKQIKWLANYNLPKPSTIAYFLKKAGLVSKYEKHISLPNTERQVAKRAHQVWQLDSQGALNVPGVGRINFVNVKDLWSGVYCGSWVIMANSHTGSPSAHQYRNSLRRAFSEFGLPEKIQVDHASVFYENKGTSPFPTRFHLWLISLGIELIFSRKYRPTDQAVVERMHQTIQNQVVRTQPFTSQSAIQRKTDERRQKLNYHIPSSSFNNQPPLLANPEAKHSGRFYCPKNEKAFINMEYVFNYLAQGKWIRKTAGSSGRLLSLGGLKYYVANADQRQKVELTFNEKTKMFQPIVFKTRRELKPFPIKGMNYEYLQGADFLDCLPSGFQFQLPFPQKGFKRGTTFLDLQGA